MGVGAARRIRGTLAVFLAVTVSGRRLTPNGSGTMYFCATGNDDACAPVGAAVTTDAAGTFTQELQVAARFELSDGTQIDCRARPGCQVVAWDTTISYSLPRTTARLCFAPPDTSENADRPAHHSRRR